jgi:4-aminobutyrate aminotransferase / (S)-3-amino-2-methylpropionate transaminase / 5-aminovalerate transaminase
MQEQSASASYFLATYDVVMSAASLPVVESAFRRIVTDLPVPESRPILEKLAKFEPVAMQGQPPVVWDRAEGFQVWDKYGNCWIDWSSGVLVTNAGHAAPEMVEAIIKQARQHLLTNYCFPNEIRANLVEKLAEHMPEPLKKVFLLTTGSETVECAIKLSRMHGQKVAGPHKNVIVSFEKAFHGRTLGSQQAGGIPPLKDWIVNFDPGFVQVPFPDGFRTTDTSFSLFERSLAQHNVTADQVCGVLMETYQGGSVAFASQQYMEALRKWCDRHQVLLIMDEVQAGFGRTGKLWGFDHFPGVVPDLTTWGKGISSSLPVSALIGRPDVMDLPLPGSMSSTHTGNPICCAAALASFEVILRDDLSGNAARMGEILHQSLADLQRQHPDRIGAIRGKGLVAGVHCVKPGGIEPDAPLARAVVDRCLRMGLLMFAPVGFGGATIKICPPLVINEAALNDSCQVFAQAFAECL